MKRTISIFILLEFFFCNAQQIIVQYEYSKQKDLVDTARATGMYFLNINETKSFFFSEAEYISYSIIQNNIENGQKPDFRSLPDDILESFIRKNRDVKSITFYSNAFLENEFEYTEVPDFQWKISNESKKILGYNTRMATGIYAGRNYKAYFTESIAVPDGPYKFSELPGLILEIGDTENLHHFVARGLELKTIRKTVDLTKRKFIKTTMKKYFELRKQFGENPLQHMFTLMSSTGVTETVNKAGNPVDIRKLLEDSQRSMQIEFNKFNQIEL